MDAYVKSAVKYLSLVNATHSTMPPVITAQYKNLVTEFMVADKYLSEANANISHEPMPTNIREIEPMMCQHSISIKEDLTKAFDGQANH